MINNKESLLFSKDGSENQEMAEASGMGWEILLSVSFHVAEL